jgi:hypothetical protein
MLSNRFFLNKKYTTENAVLTKENHDDNAARYEHSPCNPTHLAQQAQVLTANARARPETLCLLPNKIRTGSSK